MPPPGTPRTTGTFKSDEGWFCDCDPPRPADRFTVNKQGPNHGRLFYTCSKPHAIQCGFWIWEEKAQEIETMVLTRAAAQKAQKAAEVKDTHTNMPQPSATGGRSPKRLANLAVNPRRQRVFRGANQPTRIDSDDDDSDDNGDTDGDNFLDSEPLKTRSRIVSPFSAPKAKPGPITPKPARKRRLVNFGHGEGLDMDADIDIHNDETDEGESEGNGQSDGINDRDEGHHYDGKGKNAATTGQGSAAIGQHRDKRPVTPNRPQTWGSVPTGLPTPVSKSVPRNRLLFASNGNLSSSKRIGATPDVFTDEHDLTADVMGLLEGQKIDESVKQRVRQRLDTYVLRLRGTEAGRDATRAALKMKETQVKVKEAEIERLEELLENERRASQKKMAILEGLISNGKN
ncbi:hypothetical protein B0T25DRAFT_573583 [Lasiosphaeria hispida]|uniref:GRF-type domain-containing protein n=1 Tax=Lasiosphaeria hispida TaxID=260671 RepID=A0AAJ0H5S7_9PEZI|nr:hypothetical protein B0T25DRAFT_573583 [Lasiosphaeria hispida]